MPRKMFVNLPVKDLKKSIDFFQKLGFSFNPQFSDDTGACLVFGEDNYAMLLTEAKFKTFTPLPVADAAKATEVLVCLSAESRAEVDAIFNQAIAAGGTSFRPADDHGWMYCRSFKDLDGHIWEFAWMDASAIQKS